MTFCYGSIKTPPEPPPFTRKCRECSATNGILKVYDADTDTHFYICGRCYLDLYGW